MPCAKRLDDLTRRILYRLLVSRLRQQSTRRILRLSSSAIRERAVCRFHEQKRDPAIAGIPVIGVSAIGNLWMSSTPSGSRWITTSCCGRSSTMYRGPRRGEVAEALPDPNGSSRKRYCRPPLQSVRYRTPLGRAALRACGALDPAGSLGLRSGDCWCSASNGSGDRRKSFWLASLAGIGVAIMAGP